MFFGNFLFWKAGGGGGVTARRPKKIYRPRAIFKKPAPP